MKKILSLCVAGAFFIGACSILGLDGEKFNKESWDSNPDSRYAMAEDLMDSYLYKGMNREQVTELIGREDSFWSDDHTAVYNLGFRGDYSVDPQLLVIQFEQDRVTRFWLSQG